MHACITVKKITRHCKSSKKNCNTSNDFLIILNMFMGGHSSVLVIIKKCNKNKKYIATQCLSELWKRCLKAREPCNILHTVSVKGSQSKFSAACAFKSDLPSFTALQMRSQVIRATNRTLH